jgi:hypothetical protein
VEAPPPTEVPPPTEAPPQPTELPKPPEEQATLSIWVSLLPQELEVFASELSNFEGDNPGVQVQVNNLPFGEIDTALFTSLAAGVAPDMVALSYNTIARLVEQELLVPPDFNLVTNVEDFLPEAFQANFYNNTLYAIPWRRQACAPSYLSLALPKPSSGRYDLSTRLVNFLTGYEIQIKNYQGVGWYPARQSVYDDLSLSCQPVKAIRLEPQYVAPTISLVQERQSLIQAYLGDVQVNPDAATAWVESGETRTAAVPLKFPVSQQQVDEQFYGKELAIGALFVNDSPDISPGNYAVTCRADGDWATCDLIDENGERTMVKPVDFARTPQPVGQPFVLLEEGSFRKCWYLDSLKICINIG